MDVLLDWRTAIIFYSPDTSLQRFQGSPPLYQTVIGRCLMNHKLGDSTGILTIDLRLSGLLDVILRIKEVDSVVSDIDTATVGKYWTQIRISGIKEERKIREFPSVHSRYLIQEIQCNYLMLHHLRMDVSIRQIFEDK